MKKLLRKWFGFKDKAKKEQAKQKRNFENVGWEWTKTVNGESVNPFHVFSFPNGLGVVVMQHAIQTWDGMMCIAISDFNKELGRFLPLSGINLPHGVYTRAEGLDEDEVRKFCDTINNLKP